MLSSCQEDGGETWVNELWSSRVLFFMAEAFYDFILFL